MKISNFIKIVFVVATLFTFSGCEEEIIIVKNTDGDAQIENGTDE